MSRALLALSLCLAGAPLRGQAQVGPGATRDAATTMPYRPGVDILSYDLSLEMSTPGR